MKVYILWARYYDYCDEHSRIVGIFDTEDKAVMAQILEEEGESYKKCSDQYWTSVCEYEVK
jgi:hypothetical protein